MRNLSPRDQENLSKFIRANNTQSQVLNAGMSNSKDLSLNHYLPIVLGNKHANWRATYSRYSSLVGNERGYISPYSLQNVFTYVRICPL